MKTKLGISTTAYAAGVFLLALFGGYIPLIIAAGYVLIAEEDMWLKKTVVKAFVLQVAFSLLALLVNAIPTLMAFLNSIFLLFNGNFSFIFVSRFFAILDEALDICRDVVLVVSAFFALKEKTLSIGFIDRFVEKHFS